MGRVAVCGDFKWVEELIVCGWLEDMVAVGEFVEPLL